MSHPPRGRPRSRTSCHLSRAWWVEEWLSFRLLSPATTAPNICKKHCAQWSRHIQTSDLHAAAGVKSQDRLASPPLLRGASTGPPNGPIRYRGTKLPDVRPAHMEGTPRHANSVPANVRLPRHGDTPTIIPVHYNSKEGGQRTRILYKGV